MSADRRVHRGKTEKEDRKAVSRRPVPGPDGGGFSRSKMKQNTAEGHRSIGLQNIAGRIALSGGSFRIVSCPGLGTTARIILPMKGEEHIC